MTAHPDTAWVTQQAKNLSIDGAIDDVGFLVRDRDAKFSGPFDEVFRTEGVRVIRAPIRAPKANAFAERFVKTVRHECLDHVLIFGRRHLNRVLKAYVAHYVKERPHTGARLGHTRRERPNTAGPGDYPNAGRTKRRARRSDPRVSLGGVIRIVEPFRAPARCSGAKRSWAHRRSRGSASSRRSRSN